VEKYSFFDDDGTGTRVYTSADFADFFNSIISSGVINKTGNLQVTSNSNMVVSVQPGIGYINGYYYELMQQKDITITAPDGTLGRKDIICLQLDLTQNLIQIVYRLGTPSASPVAPTLTRTDVIYELCLAQITVAASAGSIPQSAITDTRLDSTKCGYVTSLVASVDTTQIYNQWVDWYNTHTAQYEQDWNDWFGGAKELNDPNKQNVITFGTSLPNAPTANDVHIKQESDGSFTFYRYDGTAWGDLFTSDDTRKFDKFKDKLDNIQDVNVTGAVAGDRLEFDGTNWIKKTIKKPFMQRIASNGTTTFPASSAFTKVIWGNQTIANWDSANSQYICPTAGVYQVSVNLHYFALPTTTNKSIYLRFKVNGVPTNLLYQPLETDISEYNISNSFCWYCNAGDQISLEVAQSSTSTSVVINPSSYSNLWISCNPADTNIYP
jgi:hypothetical protein